MNNKQAKRVLQFCFLFWFIYGVILYGVTKCDDMEHEKNVEKVSNSMEAVRNNDFGTAHKILAELYANYQKSQDNDDAELYTSTAQMIFSAEVRYLIAEMDSEEATQRIQFLLNEFMLIGEKPVAGKVFSWKNRQYTLAVAAKNALCDQVLDVCIQTKNQALAELALSHYLDNPYADEQGNTVYESTDKDAAEKKFKEAVKRSAFK